MRIPEKEGRTKKGRRKCLLKVEEKIVEKKRKTRRKEKIQSGIACGLLITKTKTQKKCLWKMYKTKPQKKKKTVFPTQNPLAEIYICTVDLSQSMEKKFTISTPPPVHFPKIMFTSCPTSLPKPRKKRSSHTSTPILVK
jgi:hypothetical protein